VDVVLAPGMTRDVGEQFFRASLVLNDNDKVVQCAGSALRLDWFEAVVVVNGIPEPLLAD